VEQQKKGKKRKKTEESAVLSTQVLIAAMSA